MFLIYYFYARNSKKLYHFKGKYTKKSVKKARVVDFYKAENQSLDPHLCADVTLHESFNSPRELETLEA